MHTTLLCLLPLMELGLVTAQDSTGNTSELLLNTATSPVLGHYAADTSNTVREYLGIPYATPPVGPLRWRAPVRARRWARTFNASTFGATCYNTGLSLPIDSGAGANSTSPIQLPNPPVESEDCVGSPVVVGI